MIEAIEAALLAAGGSLPLAKLRPVIAEALGRQRLSEGLLQSVLTEAEAYGIRVEVQGKARVLVMGLVLPPKAKAYFTEAIRTATGTGAGVYESQAEQYAAYLARRRRAGLKACHPLLWVWGYEDPSTVTPEDRAKALAEI